MTSKRLAMALWLAVASCSRAHESELGDSSTHWLKQCAADAECGGLSCECGVCSKGCSASDVCSAFGAGAVCVAGPASCGGAARICDAMCGRDADCPGSARSCVAGRCRAASGTAGDGGSAGGSDASALASDAAGGSADASDAAGSATGGDPDASLAFLCPPQRATNAGECVAEDPEFVWNGAACKAIACSCEGEDCGASYATREACEADRLAACHPPTTCTQTPWYQCNDFCPAHWVLLGGGRSFGECDRDCRLELELLPLITLDVGGCPSIEGHLRVEHADGSGREFSFGLSPSGWAEAALLSLALESADPPRVTSCTGDRCPLDVGRAWIGVSERSPRDPNPDEFSYDYGNPPPVLREVDEFIQGLIDQVRVCRGPALERCDSSGSDDGAPPPVCGAITPVGPSFCECSVGFDELATLEGTPCGLQCAACNVPDSTCGARCVQPCDGGDPAWKVVCAE